MPILENLKTYLVNETIGAGRTFSTQFFVEFPVDEIVIRDFCAVRTAGDSLEILSCPLLHQFDNGRLFAFNGAATSFGYVNKKIANAGRNIGGNFDFILTRVGGAANFTGVLTFTIEFRKYKNTGEYPPNKVNSLLK